MKNLKLRIFIPVVIVAALLLGAFVHFQSAVNNGSAKATASGYASLTPLQKRLLSGVVLSELNSGNTANLKGKPRNYFPTSDDGCPQNRGSNIKVNQNCLNLTDPDLQGRGQANNETAIAQDPNNPNHIIAGDNDYRRGDSTCGAASSLDGGRTWADSAIPVNFTRGTAFGGVARQYWQASGDPSVAWDTRGNAYYSCLAFQRGPAVTNNPDQSSAIYVFRSTHNSGASWNFPGRPVIESFNTTFFPFEDKPYITVDNHNGSPFRDRIYVTYNEDLADGRARIFESFSDNYGETFSKRVLVSTTSPLCPNSIGPSGSCDINAFSQPFTGPDGSLYVVYSNFNNAEKGPKDNHLQILLSKSTDGVKTFSAPVKVSDYYDLPDCATYQGGQDAGVSCVPEKGKSMNSVFRATNYASGAVNPLHSNQVVVTVASYINMHSKESNGCIPQGLTSSVTPLYTGVKTQGACNNDILVSVSSNGGATFTGTTTDPRNLTSINMEPGQATTDQFWQWASFSNSGRFAVSYFDRQYGRDE
ncbi:MAG: exo-alpha-sialidase, partial [Chloroflexi bacterium]